MTSLGISDLESNEGSVNSLMTKRLNKLLDTRLENNKEILEGLQELSLFFKENTLKNRRNLRSQIEKRSLSINQVYWICYFFLSLFNIYFKIHHFKTRYSLQILIIWQLFGLES